MAEAVRMRLDQLYQHGCYRQLDDAKLRDELISLGSSRRSWPTAWP